MRRWLAVIAFLVLVSAAGYYLWRKTGGGREASPTPEATVSPSAAAPTDEILEPDPSSPKEELSAPQRELPPDGTAEPELEEIPPPPDE